jgi:ABC-type spermidine/putrescine transport system permease subunit I
MATEKSDIDRGLSDVSVDHSPIQRIPGVLRPLLEHDKIRYYLQVAPAALLLGVFMFLPLLGIIVISFGEPSPFGIELGFDVGSYVEFFTSYRMTRFVDTILAGLLQVLIALFIGFPLAYYTGIRMRGSRYTLPLLLLFAIPFITNYILRTLSWIAFLGRQGVVNTVLGAFGVINQPLDWLLFSDFAVHVSLIASYVPFLLFPTWLAMSRIDDDVLRASSDLGASPLQTIRYIVLPLSLPGIVIGAVFVFVGVLGESVVPTLLGGPNVTYVATAINNAVSSLNLPLASAISTVVMLVAATIVLLWERTFGLQSIGEI